MRAERAVEAEATVPVSSAELITGEVGMLGGGGVAGGEVGGELLC
jgi:hypothetical protein